MRQRLEHSIWKQPEEKQQGYHRDFAKFRDCTSNDKEVWQRNSDNPIAQRWIGGDCRIIIATGMLVTFSQAEVTAEYPERKLTAVEATSPKKTT